MKEMIFRQFETGTPEYENEFWASLRGKSRGRAHLDLGKADKSDAYKFPNAAARKLYGYLYDESLFRRLGTLIAAYDVGYQIIAKDCKDRAEWVDENAEISIYDGLNDFNASLIDSHKLTNLVRIDEDFIHDTTFDFQDYLLRRFARTFGQSEEDAFINGNGLNQPTGILHSSKGAEIGLSTDVLTYDTVIRLFFSLKPEYRDRAVWIMNDETALKLRTMKDDAGNYLWRNSDDTILGHKVVISNFMPSAEAGKCPIVFGDFTYYWVALRKPASIRPLFERFSLYGQIAYLGIQYLDGRLIRREAIKAIQIQSESPAE